MFNKRIVTRFFLLLLVGTIKFSTAAVVTPEQLVAKVQQAAQEQLERHAGLANWVDPQFTVEVARNSRPIGACTQPPRVEPADVRTPARMRFVAICPDRGGWRYEFVTRAKISAKVAVAATDLSTGKILSPQDLLLERHDISGMPDSFSDLTLVQDMATRRTVRAGDVLRQNMLVAPTLVKRGDAVRIVAKNEQIEVSMAGEALDGGGRGATIRVKNASGITIRARVTDMGQVAPAE
ncbi:flagellar basal body P-ring formation chaperone FlgA [Pseudoduganella umbonata]|uniref:Flagella basal body P-ring formation protein FlgA n=1 Tax=Pseudoduganella umbonata TaxID=864828 RepID=A0A4P8HPZ2_9BURK|nr:flagellar basal body P-ring formation chaperone FlgA [Pseudoduganella umbonata]MBB3221443.1 flagella basal body P-ring formation protein FlgA [Pseudoduganella umbonata]QCP10598.1 flagellar basal body P-ring formation protein FlgA [Pseudoduganella umbonata]